MRINFGSLLVLNVGNHYSSPGMLKEWNVLFSFWMGIMQLFILNSTELSYSLPVYAHLFNLASKMKFQKRTFCKCFWSRTENAISENSCWFATYIPNEMIKTNLFDKQLHGHIPEIYPGNLLHPEKLNHCQLFYFL